MNLTEFQRRRRDYWKYYLQMKRSSRPYGGVNLQEPQDPMGIILILLRNVGIWLVLILLPVLVSFPGLAISPDGPT